jgi:hypothetical protein
MAIWNNFTVIWYLLWPFRNVVVIWYIFQRFGILREEKSGNPGCHECLQAGARALLQKHNI